LAAAHEIEEKRTVTVSLSDEKAVEDVGRPVLDGFQYLRIVQTQRHVVERQL
jgi:hypothetical protein